MTNIRINININIIIIIIIITIVIIVIIITTTIIAQPDQRRGAAGSPGAPPCRSSGAPP